VAASGASQKIRKEKTLPYSKAFGRKQLLPLI
jgi:hypothetical protein